MNYVDWDNQDPEEGKDSFEPVLKKTMPDFKKFFEENPDAEAQEQHDQEIAREHKMDNEI